MLNQNNFTLILFVISLFGVYILYNPFLDTIMIAVLLGIATSSLYVGIHQYVKSKLAISIIATTVFIIFFFGPIGYFIANIAIYVNSIESGTLTQTIEFAKMWVMDLPSEYEWLKDLLLQTFDEFDFKALSNQLLQLSSSFGSVSANFIKDLMLITVFYALFIYYGEIIGEFVTSLLPMSNENITSIYSRVSSTMSVVLYSILATAIFEGFLFGLIAMYLGYNGILFGILYGFASLIPVIGGAMMWLPLFFFELSQGNETNAYIVAIYSVVVISIVADTFIKPVIISRINRLLAHTSESLNALIIFFSILAGLSSFGFWGMIIGPALTSLFFAVVKITNEMRSNASM